MFKYSMSNEKFYGVVNFSKSLNLHAPELLALDAKLQVVDASQQSRSRSIIVAFDSFDTITDEVRRFANTAYWYRQMRMSNQKSAEWIVTKSAEAQGPATVDGRTPKYFRHVNVRRTESVALASVGCVVLYDLSDGSLAEMRDELELPKRRFIDDLGSSARSQYLQTLNFVLQYYPQFRNMREDEMLDRMQSIIRNSGVDTYTAGTATYYDKAVIYQNPNNNYREFVGGNSDDSRVKIAYELTALDVLHQFLTVVADRKLGGIEAHQQDSERMSRCEALAQEMVISEPNRYLTADEIATLATNASEAHDILQSAVNRLATELFAQGSGEQADLNPEWLS